MAVLPRWIPGTACDLFMSLFVLHHAAEFGVRPAWAAGVRQRLSTRSRETLERIFSFSTVPLPWLGTLAEPLDGQTLLRAVADLEPARRLPLLTLPGKLSVEAHRLLEEIAGRGSWSAEDKAQLISIYGHGRTPSPAGFDNILNAWTDLRGYGERYLDALQEYYLVYFADEEARLGPAIEGELREARALAERLPLAQLVERLSHGVRLQDIDQLTGVVLLPSWWVAPLVFLERAGTEVFIAFGARPKIQGGADGSEAPDGLVTAFKVLGDSTRLRILYYLASGPLSPSELARRLRLRPPTIIHHLQALRLAGLVQITVSAGFEKRYEARPEALQAIHQSLQDYLNIHV